MGLVRPMAKVRETNVIFESRDTIISVVENDFQKLFRLTMLFNRHQEVVFYSANVFDFFLNGHVDLLHY